jgi:hypothetical protein
MQGSYVSEVARRPGVRPRDISDLFYQRKLSDECCPVIGGRRIIPPDYVPTIAEALRKEGLIGSGTSRENHEDTQEGHQRAIKTCQ